MILASGVGGMNLPPPKKKLKIKIYWVKKTHRCIIAHFPAWWLEIIYSYLNMGAIKY